MSMPFVPVSKSVDPAAPMDPDGSGWQIGRERSMWSLQVLLPMTILLAGLAIIVQLWLVTSYFDLRHARQSSRERAHLISTRLAENVGKLLASDDRASLVNMLETATSFHDADIAVVIDDNDRVLYSSDPRWDARPLEQTPLAKSLEEARAARAEREPRTIETETAIVAVRPLRPPTTTPHVNATLDPRLVVLGVSTDEQSGSGKRLVLMGALTSGAVIVGVAGLVWLIIAKVLLRPLERLLAHRGEKGSARDIVNGHGRPVAELVRVADALDSLAAMTRERERALAVSRRLARIVEQSLHEVYVVDAGSYLVSNANRTARGNLGYCAAELDGMHPLEFIVGWGPGRLDAVFAAVRQEPTAQHEIRNTHRRKDGSLYPVRAHMQYLSGENPPVFILICQDITEQQRGVDEMRLRERAIEAVELGIIISDASTDGYPVVYANRALYRMTGYTTDELIGRPPSLLQGDEQGQPGVLQVDEAQSHGASVQTRLDCIRKDGSRFVMRLTLSPVHDNDGMLTHYIGIHEDITSEIETEARLLQAQRIDAVGQLAGGIAHDFNNLLDIVVGNLELIARATSDDDQLERIDEAHGAASAGARLTQRLLAFARQGSFEPRVLDVNHRIGEMLPLLRASVGESIVIETDLDEAPWSACVDPSEIENTLINLVINARDAIAGEGRIRISTANVRLQGSGTDDLAAGDYICLAVLDDGDGMSETVRARAFEPFFTTKEPGRGTGLGLASVHGFARQSGGTVEIDSEPDRGTAVRVYLPRSASDAGTRVSQSHALSAECPREARVLVVEDNAMVREVTLLRLEALGFETLAASDGIEAKRILGSGERVDLVLSDVVMPGGVSGHDLVRWIRESGPDCPILLVSGFAVPSTARDSQANVPPPKILAKPYGLDALREAIDDTLASSSE